MHKFSRNAINPNKPGEGAESTHSHVTPSAVLKR